MLRGPSVARATGPGVLIVGASARAAAFSALRAGLRPICLDQFADADLQAVAPVVRMEALDPAECVAQARQFPGLPLIYTGGMENHPDLIDQLAEQRPVWGIHGESLRNIRDPFKVASALATARLPHLEVRRPDDPPPTDGDWLLKPLRSGGGQGITPWGPEAASAATLNRPHFFQRRMDGAPCSAVFLAQEGIGDVRFVGITRQLIAEPALHGRPYAWCGNVGPAALDVAAESRIRRIANFLKWKFELRGLFGLDFQVSETGDIGLTEVNPRYPASLEILEFATGIALLRDHCQCFAGEDLDLPQVPWRSAPDCVLGKGVLYSPADVNVHLNSSFDQTAFSAWPQYGDVPASGALVREGDPILTVYARGSTADECRAELFRSAEATLQSLQSESS